MLLLMVGILLVGTSSIAEESTGNVFQKTVNLSDGNPLAGPGGHDTTPDGGNDGPGGGSGGLPG